MPAKKSKMPKQIHAVDLFCGAGGTSQGLALACRNSGVDVDLVAVNHWHTAVNTHAANHPWARHYCVPVEAVNPREAFPGGVVHILCASPECTHHSTARGGKPTTDQLRASAWHIMRWINELDVRTILVENVPEFRAWGPVSQKTGRPIKNQKGRYFKAFIQALSACGYAVQWRILNAADYGDATSRRRLFLLARKGRKAPAWPKQTHSRLVDGKPMVPGTMPWCSARSIIDWSLKGESIFDRQARGLRPLAHKTVERIIKGLARYGGAELQPFLLLLRGTGAAAGGDRSASSGQRDGVGEPFVLSQASGGAPRPVREPTPTSVAGGGGSLVEPVILPPDGPGGNGAHNHAKSVREPVPTIRATRGDRIGLIEPVVVPYNGNGQARGAGQPLPTATTVERLGVAEPLLVTTDRPETNRSLAKPATEPIPTVTAQNDRIALAEPFLVPQFGERGGQDPRTHGVDDPLPTVTSHGAGALAEPLLVTRGGADDKPDDADASAPTQDKWCLVQPVIGGRALDIRFRMLQPHELARAMGFPGDYAFVGTKREVVKQVGNAVAVNMSHALITSLLTGQSDCQVRLPTT